MDTCSIFLVLLQSMLVICVWPGADETVEFCVGKGSAGRKQAMARPSRGFLPRRRASRTMRARLGQHAAATIRKQSSCERSMTSAPAD
jgi:hypothetical protein